MIKALLASDDDLRRHQAKAYQTAINGTWPDLIGTGDALALFLTAAIQARAIQEGSRFPIRGFFLMVEQSARRHRGPSSRFQVAIRCSTPTANLSLTSMAARPEPMLT